MSESFDLRSAKARIGKTVNLHLKDGSTIINVTVLRVDNRKRKLVYKAQKQKPSSIHVNEIQYAETLSEELINANI